MAATILGQAGYLVNVAGDAQGALASAVKAAPRAILSTVTLPAVDGRPWWERLRGIIDARVIPFVFLIGPSGTAADVRGFIHGLDECLAKPFRVEDLARWYARWWRARRIRPTRRSRVCPTCAG